MSWRAVWLIKLIWIQSGTCTSVSPFKHYSYARILLFCYFPIISVPCIHTSELATAVAVGLVFLKVLHLSIYPVLVNMMSQEKIDGILRFCTSVFILSGFWWSNVKVNAIQAVKQLGSQKWRIHMLIMTIFMRSLFAASSIIEALFSSTSRFTLCTLSFRGLSCRML